MDIFRNNILLFFGAGCGSLVAAGIFTFINSLGIVTRLAQVTRTADKLLCYETWISLGAVFGNVWWLIISDKFLAGNLEKIVENIPDIFAFCMLSIFGLLSGIFVGCLIGAIAEILDAFPIMFRRIHLASGLAWVIAALAAGKFTGIIFQFFL